MKIHCPGGPPEILLGNDAAVDGKTYLGVERSSTVYVVDSAIKAQLAKKADDFRDRRLTTLDGTQVDKFSITTNAGQIEAEKRQGHWQLLKPINARGDDQKISDFIAQIINTHIDTFVSGNPVAFGLAEPALTVSLSTPADPKPVTLELGNNDKGKVYARVEGRNGIFLVAGKLEEALFKKPDDLRDAHLIRINFDIVDRINIEPAGRPKIVLARKEENWIIKSLGDRMADGGAMKTLAAALQQQTTVAFVADVSSELAKYGLDRPPLKITFSSYASENTPESTAGERPIETIAFGKADGANVYARLEGKPFVVSVPKTALDPILTNATQWQDLAIFKVKPDDITAIDVVKPGQPEVALERAGAAWKQTKGPGQVNTSNIQSFCNTLASLHAVRWTGEVAFVTNPALTVTFTAGNAPVKLIVGAESSDHLSPAIVDGAPGRFLLSKPDVEALRLMLAGSQPPAPSPVPAATPAASAAP